MSLRTPAPHATVAPAQSRLNAVLKAGLQELQRRPAPVGVLPNGAPNSTVLFAGPQEMQQGPAHQVAPNPAPEFTITQKVQCTANGQPFLVINQPMVDRANAEYEEPLIFIKPGPLHLEHYHGLGSEALRQSLEFVNGSVSDQYQSYNLLVQHFMTYSDGGTAVFKVYYDPSGTGNNVPLNLDGGDVRLLELKFKLNPAPEFTITQKVQCTANGQPFLVINQPMVDRANAEYEEPLIFIKPGPLHLEHYHGLGSEALRQSIEFVNGSVSEQNQSYNLLVQHAMTYRDGGTAVFKVYYDPSGKGNYVPLNLVNGDAKLLELTFKLKSLFSP